MNEIVVMNSLDVDGAIESVNKIIDNVRCVTCNKLAGARLRYSCGHTACDDCVIFAQDCQTCTPPSQRVDSNAKLDNPLTQSVSNAIDLLEACHNLFDADAFHRKRLSKQLKIEKELFPKCIQAPAKYENKRKSSFKDKENRYSTIFPGEAVSISKESNMENTANYVQQWLNKNNLARKPFSDLNVNTQCDNNPQIQNVKQHVKDEYSSINANRKRSHFKTTNKDYSRKGGNRKLVHEFDRTPKKIKKESTFYIGHNNEVKKKFDNNESGIYIDDDSIVICDSQEDVIDKDKNAWLAVLEACNKEAIESTSVVSPIQVNSSNDRYKKSNISAQIENKKSCVVTKVPFYKKSLIIETCQYCKNDLYSDKTVAVSSQSKPVTITIDGDNFVTTITVFKNEQNHSVVNNKNTVSVQTDISKAPVNSVIDVIKTNDCNKINICTDTNLVLDETCNECDTTSEDLFADDRQISEYVNETTHKSKCVVIEESDNDTDLDISGPMSVKADVHRSCEESEYGILTDVVNVEAHKSKPRRRPRGHTPTSTDSSEKENYNPNRIKKHFTLKKKKNKKH